MPMLYVVQNGGNFVEEATHPEKIIYLTCKITDIINSGILYYFSDGHATDYFTSFYDQSQIANLPNIIDWSAIKASYWGGSDNLETKRKKQAEFFVGSDVAPKYLSDFGCYNALGAGNGGLEWECVKKIIDKMLSSLIDVEIFVYEPTTQIKEVLKKERVKLTDARALLLAVLYDLVKNGEYVSEFSSEKVCYFIQRFGAEQYFKLKFEPNFYGPYSGKVRYILNVLNGSYIMGYSDMNKKPFNPLILINDGYDIIKDYIDNRLILKEIVEKTTNFLTGFYSDFALELLSSVNYITCQEKTFDKLTIYKKLNEWNDRKRSLFSNSNYIDLSLKQVKKIYL